MKKSFILLLSIGVFTFEGVAQISSGVHSSDIMYKKTVTRAIDLREKQNLPLFSRNNEITKILLEAVNKGIITPYTNDSLSTRLTNEAFSNKLLSPNAANLSKDTSELYLEFGEEWREVAAAIEAEKYGARDLYQMEIKEAILFDKNHSRMIYDIKTVTLFIPADHPLNEKGIQMPIASFNYKELVSNLFKDNPKAIWYNKQNDQEHKNIADAFELRLFGSYIIKVSNPNDAYLSDLYRSQEDGIKASTWSAHELLEYEHNLWEY